jgi:hypothetical protein
MSKNFNHKGRTKSLPFVMLKNNLFDSKAWGALTANARCAYAEIRRRYNSNNNGEIPLSCRELGARLNISKATATRAFDELIKMGFIKIGKDSNFNWKTKTARRWILTDEVYDGKSPTNEWRNYNQKQNTVSNNSSTVSPIEPKYN